MSTPVPERTSVNTAQPPPSLAVAKELIAGTAGGTAQICVGHPFDTVKVKLQSMKAPKPGQLPQYSGAMDVVRQVVAKEGVRGLFAGIQAPLPFVAVFNASLFAANGTCKRLIGKGRTDEQLTLPEIGLAGIGAGIAVSFVACPTELVKCRLQATPSLFNGAIDCTRQVVATKGMGGLYTGMSATVIREMPGNALYFMTYAAAQRSMIPEGGSSKDLSSMQLLFAGGLAGLAFWIPCYPIDFCKTLIQTDNPLKPKYHGFFDCMRKVVNTQGVSALYRGVGPCLARAFPANAVTLLAFEWTKKTLG